MKKQEIAQLIENMGSAFLIDAIALIDYYLTHNRGNPPEQNHLLRGIQEMKFNELVMARKLITEHMFMRDAAFLNASGRGTTTLQSTQRRDIKERLRRLEAQRDKVESAPKLSGHHPVQFSSEDRALLRDIQDRIAKVKVLRRMPDDVDLRRPESRPQKNVDG